MFLKTVESIGRPPRMTGASVRNASTQGARGPEVSDFPAMPAIQSCHLEVLSFHYTTTRKVDTAMKGLKVSLLALLVVLGASGLMLAQSSNGSSIGDHY